MPYIGNTVQTQGFAPAIDYFNGNGVTVTFTLSRPVASVAQLIVAIDNVIQNPSSAFTVAGNAITFTSAPLAGTNNIWVEYTSLITTYQGISQDPTVIGDIRATGGYLAEGDFGNSFVDGAILDYVTGAGRVTVGELDDLVFYHGGTAGRSEMMKVSYAGNSTLVGGLTATGAGSFQGVTVGKGGGNSATNTVVGAGSLTANTTGTGNDVFGSLALPANTTGNNNSAFGRGSLLNNTTGSFNAGFGYNSLALNTTGANNSAVGWQALFNNTTASVNTAVGYQALYANTTGAANNAFGANALDANTTASYNNAFGNSALGANTTGTENNAFGYWSLLSNTTGNYNAAFGEETLRFNTTGSNNTAIGTYALLNNTTSNNNTAVGFQAGVNNTTGTTNTFVGKQAGYLNTNGGDNTFIGNLAGYTSNSGNANSGNTCVGSAAGYLLTTGIGNTFIGGNNPIGYPAGYFVTTGSKNVILGGYSGNAGGLDIRTASNNVVLSDGDGNIKFAYENSSNTTKMPDVYTNTSGTAANVVILASGTICRSTSSLKYKRDVQDAAHGLAEVLTLRPVTYKGKAVEDGDKIFGGLIAEEVDAAGLNEFVQYADDGTPDALAYGNMVSLCIKAIQEQQAMIEELKTKVAALEAK